MFAVLDQVNDDGYVLIGMYSTQQRAMDAVISHCSGTRAHLVSVTLDREFNHKRDCISCKLKGKTIAYPGSDVASTSKSRVEFMRESAARSAYIFQAPDTDPSDLSEEDDESIPDLVNI